MLLEGQMKTCPGEREVEKLLCAKTPGVDKTEQLLFANVEDC